MKLDKYIGKRVFHRANIPVSFKNNEWQFKTEDRDVILMAVVGAYAMVRRPKAFPYVVDIKHLRSKNAKVSSVR